jgi:hypothetical protein
MKLENLLEDSAFMDEYKKIMTFFEKYDFENIVIKEVLEPLSQTVPADELNKRAAIKYWTLEGALLVIDFLKGGLLPVRKEPEIASDYKGEL